MSIDLDEPFSIFHAQKNLAELSKLFINENNPPLHFYLLHLWIKLFGTSAFSVRFLSLIFSVLTLPVLFFIGIKIRNEYLGLLLMLMFTCSNFHHSYGIEARTYPLFTFLFATILLFMLKVREEITWQKSGALGILCALLFYAHYMAIIAIPFVFLIHFFLSLKAGNIRKFWPFLVMLIVFTVLLLPFLNVFMKRLAHVQEAGTWVERPHWSLLYGMVNKFMNGPLVLLSFVIIMLVFIALKKIELPNIKKIKWDNPIVIVAVMTIGIYLFAFIISLLTNSSIFIDRYMYFLSLGWFTLLGYVSIFIFDKNLKIIILPLLIFIIGFNPFRTHNRESDQLVAYAKSFNGSYIITPPHYDLTFLFHGEKELFQDLKEGVALFQHEIYPIHGLHEVDMQHVKRPIILIDAGSEFLYGERKLLEDLKQQFSLIENRAFKGGYEVFVFN